MRGQGPAVDVRYTVSVAGSGGEPLALPRSAQAQRQPIPLIGASLFLPLPFFHSPLQQVFA